jgi:zinc protease
MKRLLPVMLCAVTSLCVGQEVRLSVPCTRLTLPNGLNVILHEDHTTPTVTVNLWYRVGSAREKPGRTGFAHLFEHIMFEGSQHVAEGKFDRWLEAVGGDNNASTGEDRTNYYIMAPVNALELALFLESDRMGFLLPAMSPATVDGQRDVVKNERRQGLENQPYGMVEVIMSENMFPADHPYHWPVIGSMEDLSAASYGDVVEFFKKYYTTGNASLCVAGDIDAAKTASLVGRWFADVAGGPAPLPQTPEVAILSGERRLLYQDNVQLPRLYMSWHTPSLFSPGDAEMDLLASILSAGKNSRLYRRLVYELQIAQDVFAFQQSMDLSSLFQIVATAREGHTLGEIEKVIQEEIDRLKHHAPELRELQRAVNQREAGYLSAMENLFRKADLLNAYYTRTGNPDYFNEDLSRYRAVDPGDLQTMAQLYLKDDARLVLCVVPKGHGELASGDGKEVHPK